MVCCPVFSLLRYKRTLARKINARQCDVVIGVHAFMALHLSAVKNRIQTKTVGWLHNSYGAFFEKETPYLPGLDYFFQVQMRKLDERVVLSHADAGCFFRKMNLCCEVIYNPLTVLPKGRGRRNIEGFWRSVVFHSDIKDLIF